MRMSIFQKVLLAGAILLAPAFSQQNLSGGVDGDALVRERAELNKARADLEEARQKRDMEVAARWNDREKANGERELFNQKYDEAKEELDRLMEERVRLEENVRVAREDLAQVRQSAEERRTEYLSLVADKSIIEPFREIRERGVPFRLPQRIEDFNRTEKEISLYRDNPLKVAKGVFGLAKKELDFTREIERREGEVLFDENIVQGEEMRLGGLYAVRKSSGTDSSVAMMLPVAGDRGASFAFRMMTSADIRSEVADAFRASRDSLFMMVPVDVLLSTTLSSEIAASEEKPFREVFWQTFQDGGILMYPIALLFVIGIILVVERFVVLLLKGATIRYRRAVTLVSEGKLEEAKALAQKMHGSVGKVIRAGILRDYADRESAEKAIEEVFAAEVPQLERGLSSISVMATTAPLLGLLGTVMGMIQLFQVITMHGTSDPKLLAGGISVALVTTEAGLIVAIPLQLLVTFLSNRVDGIRARMEKAGLAVLNSRWLRG